MAQTRQEGSGLSVGRNRQDGFTFLEAIVVSLILAILAAVAIPTYSGYVENQKHAVVKNLAQTAAVAANVYWRKTGAPPSADARELELFLPDPERYRVTIEGDNVIVQDLSVQDLSAMDINISASVSFR